MLEHSINLDAYFDIMADDMVMVMKRVVYAHKMEEGAISYPTTWWDHFKQRWFPAWLKKLYPVRMTTKDFKVYRTYPDKVFPKERSYINVQVLEREEP